MDYTAMMQDVPQMGVPFGMMAHHNDMSRPRHAYSFPYSSGSHFMVPQMHDAQAMAHAAKQTDPKPRLAKDEVQLLEGEFQKNPKPSSQRKREIAELLKVDNPRINNWFQNRRAKAKQMMRRDADPRAPGDDSPTASSPSEHQEDSLVSEYYGSKNQSLPLRASSATFPAMEHPSLSIYPPTHNGAVSHGTSPSAEEYPSPKSFGMPSGVNHNMTYTPVMNSYIATGHHGSIDSDQADHGHDFEHSLGAYVPFTTEMGMEPVMAHVGSFQSELLSVDDVPHLDKDMIVMPSCEVQSLDHILPLQMSSPGSAHSPASAVSDLQLKSPPPPANLATRRNKGAPAMLNSTAFRNNAFGPKTGMDMGKRIEGPTPIRRIASATGLGPSRIQKPPRSPLFFERNKDALLHSLQTHNAGAGAGASSSLPLGRSLSNNVSPVTPNDGIAMIQHGVADAMISSGSDDEQILPYGAPSQQGFYTAESTLKSRSTTPGYNGMARQAEQHHASWNSFISHDEALLTPSLGSFGSDEYGMLQAAPGYVVSSQPPTPSVNQPLGHSYFPLRLQGGSTSGQADYTFPGEAYTAYGPPLKATSGQSKGKQFQFTQNVTPQDFSLEK